MGKKNFDYYIFVDYTEEFIGYHIIEREKIKDLIAKTSKIRHYKEVKHKKQYLKAIKRIFEKNDVANYFRAFKIKKIWQNLEIFADIIEFIKSYKHYLIFISIDDKHYSNFERLVKVVDSNNIFLIKEGNLRKDSIEFKLSLIIDNLLNLERTKNTK
ncbi:hypothetical protein HYW75_06980 [Candidatus Pacearchaeota archaeon]|nr:hypothetical protein [Candidatus Pacearchaeota archaeon]